jgi:hypothetical protein
MSHAGVLLLGIPYYLLTHPPLSNLTTFKLNHYPIATLLTLLIGFSYNGGVLTTE